MRCRDAAVPRLCRQEETVLGDFHGRCRALAMSQGEEGHAALLVAPDRKGTSYWKEKTIGSLTFLRGPGEYCSLFILLLCLACPACSKRVEYGDPTATETLTIDFGYSDTGATWTDAYLALLFACRGDPSDVGRASGPIAIAGWKTFSGCVP